MKPIGYKQGDPTLLGATFVALADPTSRTILARLASSEASVAELADCEIDLTMGGAYRYLWRHDENGTDTGMGGVFREIVAPERFVVTERFDESWYPGEAVVTNSLAEQGGKTTFKLTILYDSRGARDIALKSPVEEGVAASYDRLAELLTAGGTVNAARRQSR